MPSRHCRWPHLVALLGCLSLSFVFPAGAQDSSAQHTFVVDGTRFRYDGQPFQIISGEMHYPRVPREYWRDRMRKARAMGLNTITTYAFWNVHETSSGVYDFAGQNDIAEYIREAQQEGLKVILRPGPYVCAEWELGGYPSWLLKDPALVLRSADTKYNAAVKAWFARLSEEIRPLLLKNGGPIIAVQIENEYGAYGKGTIAENQAYLEMVKQELTDVGMGDALLFTSNQPGDLAKGSLPGVPTVVNFGTGDARKAFHLLEQARPEGPRMTGEYWAGWFDKWGEKHHETAGATEAAEFRWMLEQGYSVSLYMFHGGTTFGWMNGADSHTGKDYHPDTTSYDYDAPLNERGEPRYKYDLFRKAIGDVTHTSSTGLPAPGPHKTFAIDATMRTASLWRNLPTPITSKVPLTFEELDQAYGYVLYRTGLDEGDGGTLILAGLHDYAQVYVDQQLVGVLDRRLGTDRLELPRQTHASTLDILVENTGRVNYSHAIVGERTGLTGAVTLDGKALAKWENFSLPIKDPAQLRFLPEPCSGPCFYQTNMLTPAAEDTYLDTRGLHKGQIWMGEHNLGRFWTVGPQFALYAPGPWMKPGQTRITFFDLLGDASDRLISAPDPIYGETAHSRESQ